MKQKKSLKTGFFIFLFLLIFSFIANASGQKIYIKVTMGECLKCYGEPLGTNSLLNKNAEINLVFKDYGKGTITQYLKSQYPVDISKVKIISSDSLYNALNKNYFSELFVVKQNKPVFSCLMKNLDSNLSYINFLLSDFPSEIKISDKVNIISARYFDFINNSFYVYDLFLSTIYQIGKNGELIMKTDKDSFDFDSVFMQVLNDKEQLNVFNKFKPDLKKMGKGSITIQSIFVNDSSLFIDMIVPFIKVKGDTVRILGKEVIARKSEKTGYEFYTIDENSLPLNYYPASFNYFYKLKNSNIFKIIMMKSHVDSTENYFMGNFALKKNKLVFQSFDSLTLPDIFIKERVYYDFLSPVNQHDNYLVLNSSNVIYNLSDKSKIETPFKNTGFVGDRSKNMLHVNNYFLNDFLIDNNTIYYVFYDINEKQYYFQKTGPAFTAGKKIRIKQMSEYKHVKSSLRFINEEVIYFITDDNKIVFIKVPDN